MFKDLLKRWLEFVEYMNKKGVPLPVVRMDGKASLSATLVIVSFTLWAISIVGKAAGALGGMDSASCFNMFMACSALYWGRKFQKDSGTLGDQAKQESSNDVTKEQ